MRAFTCGENPSPRGFKYQHEGYGCKVLIDDKTHQFILSSIAGDGSLSLGNALSKYPRLQFNMGNKKHAESKFKMLSKLGSVIKKRVNGGFGDYVYSVNTKSHPALVPYLKRFGQRKKNLDVIGSGLFEELNGFGWANYFFDDGHLCKSSEVAFFHTECFSIDQVRHISQCLNNFIGYDCSKINSYVGGTKKRLMHSIRMNKNGTRKFMESVKENMVDGMEYKELRNN